MPRARQRPIAGTRGRPAPVAWWLSATLWGLFWAIALTFTIIFAPHEARAQDAPIRDPVTGPGRAFHRLPARSVTRTGEG